MLQQREQQVEHGFCVGYDFKTEGIKDDKRSSHIQQFKELI
jgi:hypothetical protein